MLGYSRFLAKALHSKGLIALHTHNQMGGTVSYDLSKYRRHGVLSAVTHRQSGVPGLHIPSTGFDGATSYNNIYTAGFANDNLLLNPGFETAGAGGVDIWANWEESVSDGALANETTIIHKGVDAAKITAGTGRATFIYQDITVVAGKKYRLRFWTRALGVRSVRYALYDNSNSADIVVLAETLIIGTTYTAFVKEFTAPAGCTSVRLYLRCPNGATDVAYVDACEVRRMDGFLGDEGTLLAWAKVSAAGVWADGAARVIAETFIDNDNYIWLYKFTDNVLYFTYKAGGVQEQVGLAITPTTFFNMGITWSKSGDAVKAYYNGVQAGLTQTALGTWAGNLSATRCTIGARNVAAFWSGPIGPVPIFNEAKSPTEMKYLMSP